MLRSFDRFALLQEIFKTLIQTGSGLDVKTNVQDKLSEWAALADIPRLPDRYHHSTSDRPGGTTFGVFKVLYRF